MKKIMLSAVIAAAIGITSQVNASLVVTIEPTSGPTAVPVIVASGNVLTFNIIATVTGQDAITNEGLNDITGSVVSVPTMSGATALSPVGNVSNFLASAAFGNTTTPGVQQDLNGLPGLDLGSNRLDVANDYIFARNGSIVVGAGPGDISRFVVGTVTFTISSTNVPGATTNLVWIPQTADAGGTPLNTAAIWRQDGASKFPSAANSYSGGTALQVASVPEPASLALAAVGGMGLLLRRRK